MCIRDRIRRGIPSPAIYTSSPSLNGNSVPDIAIAERLESFTDQMNLKKIKPFIDEIKKLGTWVVPTQTLFTRWYSPDNAKTRIVAENILDLICN